MLSNNQFQVLSRRLASKTASQRSIATEANISLGSVNKAMRELKAVGFIQEDGAITNSGISALEPYRVESAVILAAGVGARIAPFSYERPKALLVVKGEVLIERAIRQLQEVGIKDISVVVGYMRESLFYLEEKFGVRLVTSSDYLERNNHSSLLAAKQYLGNSYILSSDQYYSENPFHAYMYETSCSGVWVYGRTNARVMITDRTGHVVESPSGGTDALAAIGPAYLERTDSEKLISLIERDFSLIDTEGKLWESFLFDNLGQFSPCVEERPVGMIHEFDFLSDLCAFDENFIESVDCSILDNICAYFNCERDAIIGIEPIKEGLTNLSFMFFYKDTPYVYRHPGNGTEEIISREAEEAALRIAKELGLDKSFVFEDPKQGWKISRFLTGCIPFDYKNETHVNNALSLLSELHQSGRKIDHYFDPIKESSKILSILRSEGYPLPKDFDDISLLINELTEYFGREIVIPVLCHNDFYGPNILVHADGMDIIDWEYAAMGDYANDIGNFVAQGSGYTVEEAETILDYYFGRKPTKKELCHCMASIAIVGFYWYVWAMFKEAKGQPVGDWIEVWYRSAKRFGRHALNLYRAAYAMPAVKNLTRNEFDDLVARFEAGEASISDLATLEPYRARRAVLFASGFGSRMLPITMNTPKPLVRVKGRRIIESILDALLNVGIEQILIVRGYLADEFDILLKKYPMILFVDNPVYDSTNNISSAVAAIRADPNSLCNAYVFESDLYLKNPALITRYQWRSNYLGVPVEETSDWCLDVEDGIVRDLHKGGTDCCHMYGVSYWTFEDGVRLAQDLPIAFAKEENKQRFWDDVPCILSRDNYTIALRECTFEDIDEIDSFEELCQIDSAYLN